MSIAMISSFTSTAALQPSSLAGNGDISAAGNVANNNNGAVAELSSHELLSADVKQELTTMLFLGGDNDNKGEKDSSLAGEILSLYMAAGALQAIGAFNYVMNAAAGADTGGAAGGFGGGAAGGTGGGIMA